MKFRLESNLTVALPHERREAFISVGMTGQIDVRQLSSGGVPNTDNPTPSGRRPVNTAPNSTDRRKRQDHSYLDTIPNC